VKSFFWRWTEASPRRSTRCRELWYKSSEELAAILFSFYLRKS